ncbi:hypothetical protein HU200_021706 [Digitaria exilis]|uniref:Uncharacterized protein n=1 Tax=Digitaria exilis TaxID=1010633 RepID=A0A835EZI5_9POAL|nr:hypothetical protein HU200_021706 [Digitaria exilis]
MQKQFQAAPDHYLADQDCSEDSWVDQMEFAGGIRTQDVLDNERDKSQRKLEVWNVSMKIDGRLLVAPWPELAALRLRRAAAHVQGLLQGRRLDEGRCLAVRDGALVLAPADPADEHQHWFKDARLSLWVKGIEGKPVFFLVNKATGLAVQHSLGPYRPVRLVKFNPDDFDESVLWTESGHMGREFGSIRSMHNVGFGLDAISGDGEDGNDGSVTFLLSEWARGNTQSRKILYWNDAANTTLAGLESEPTCRIYYKADESFSVTVRDGAVCLAPTDSGDAYQHWIQDKRPGKHDQGRGCLPSFRHRQQDHWRRHQGLRGFS